MPVRRLQNIKRVNCGEGGCQSAWLFGLSTLSLRKATTPENKWRVGRGRDCKCNKLTCMTFNERGELIIASPVLFSAVTLSLGLTVNITSRWLGDLGRRRLKDLNGTSAGHYKYPTHVCTLCPNTPLWGGFETAVGGGVCKLGNAPECMF